MVPAMKHPRLNVSAISGACLEEVEETIRGKASLARLEAALTAQYDEQCDNKLYQYYWALRHPVVKDAISKALVNRFPAR
jgi:hypothetical protein